MITYNQLIQDTLTEVSDYEKSQDLISAYGQYYKKIEDIDILPNQKQLLSFPLWNSNSNFIPTTSVVTLDVQGPDPSYIGWQFKYGFTNETEDSVYFGRHPHEKRYFFSQSLGYVINAKTSNTDTNHDNILFYYGYGNFDGSGSVQNTIGGSAPSEILNSTPSKIIYRAVRNQLIDTDEKLKLGDFTELNDFFYIKIPRAIYREKIQKKSFSLTLKSQTGVTLSLTDDTIANYTVVDNQPLVPIVSGTLDSYYTGSEVVESSEFKSRVYYGILDTNNGYLLLSPSRIANYFSANGVNIQYTTASNASLFEEFRYTGHGADTKFTWYNNLRVFTSLIYSGSISSPFKLNGLETYTYDTYYISVGANEFNRSTNPTYLTGSNTDTFKTSVITDDFVYITSIGLYNDNGDLLAVAKLSTPVLKKRGDVKLFKINISI